MDLSPLNKLPGELRNRIYEFTLRQDGDLEVVVEDGMPRLLPWPYITSDVLGLASTCHQTRQECLPIFYETNKFNLVYKRDDFSNKTVADWQIGVRRWLYGIGEQNRKLLSIVEIDVGDTSMFSHHPSSETVWRSVSGLLEFFTGDSTQVIMKTEVSWTRRSKQTFSLSLPLKDPTLAHRVVDQVLEKQRHELYLYCRDMQIEARNAAYQRMELETCGQEIRNFVGLLETAHVGRS